MPQTRIAKKRQRDTFNYSNIESTKKDFQFSKFKYNKDYEFNIIKKYYQAYNNEQIINILKNGQDINERLVNLQLNHKFKIVTCKYGIYISKQLQYMLESLGLETTIIYDIQKKDSLDTDCIFIILFPHEVSVIPIKSNYIIYQLEQIQQSPWLTRKTIEIIKNSIFTMDYSLYNLNILSNLNDEKLNSKLFYQPMPIMNESQKNTHVKNDILFFGGLNTRRQTILNRIKNEFNIKIISGRFGEEIEDLIKTSKIIINLHYYRDAVLETARLNEVIIYNKIIISELGISYDYNNDLYKNNVIFIENIKDDLSNIGILVDKLRYYMDSNNYTNFIQLSNNDTFVKKLFDDSIYYLKKNLQIINNDIYY